MQIRSSHVQSCLLLAALSLSGCGSGNSDPYDRNPVNGTVQLDGKPLTTGSIVFFPVEQGPVVSGTSIKDGKFAITQEQGLPSGSYKVAITAAVLNKAPPADSTEMIEDPPSAISIIPIQYNTKTTLHSEVQNSKENTFSFDLKSK